MRMHASNCIVVAGVSGGAYIRPYRVKKVWRPYGTSTSSNRLIRFESVGSPIILSIIISSSIIIIIIIIVIIIIIIIIIIIKIQ